MPIPATMTTKMPKTTKVTINKTRQPQQQKRQRKHLNWWQLFTKQKEKEKEKEKEKNLE